MLFIAFCSPNLSRMTKNGIYIRNPCLFTAHLDYSIHLQIARFHIIWTYMACGILAHCRCINCQDWIFACAAISTAAALCTLSTGLMIIASTFCATNVSTCVSCFVASSSAKTTFLRLHLAHCSLLPLPHTSGYILYKTALISLHRDSYHDFFRSRPTIPKHRTNISNIVVIVFILLFIYLPPHQYRDPK